MKKNYSLFVFAMVCFMLVVAMSFIITNMREDMASRRAFLQDSISSGKVYRKFYKPPSRRLIVEKDRVDYLVDDEDWCVELTDGSILYLSPETWGRYGPGDTITVRWEHLVDKDRRLQKNHFDE